MNYFLLDFANNSKLSADAVSEEDDKLSDLFTASESAKKTTQVIYHLEIIPNDIAFGIIFNKCARFYALKTFVSHIEQKKGFSYNVH